MRRLEVSSGLLLTILLISCLLGAYALSKPAYLPEKYPSFVPGLLAVYGQKLVVHDPAKGSIVILDPETGELRGFPAPRNIRDLEISGSWVALAPSGSQKLLIYDLETGESRELRLPGDVYALESADGLFWASIPDRELVVVPAEHPIYHCFYDLDGPPKIHVHDGKPPQGLGVFDGDRLILFYTYESDVGDGLEDPDVHGDPPEKREQALRMAINVLYYALTR